MTKETILQEVIVKLNLYEPNNIVSNYIKQKLTEVQEKSTIRMEFLDMPLLINDTSDNKKVRTEKFE